MLTNSYNGLGEPINVIVSGESDSQVLSPAGFYNYALSLDFGEECLGLHDGVSITDLKESVMKRSFQADTKPPT